MDKSVGIFLSKNPFIKQYKICWLGFGATADIIGRRKVFICTCTLVIVGAFLSSTVQNTSGTFGIYSQLCLWRFILGVGVGGEYPLSASITAESSHGDSIARNLAMVFTCQGLGTLICALVLVTVTSTLGKFYSYNIFTYIFVSDLLFRR